MKTYERDPETRTADIKRAMAYSHRARRYRLQKMKATINRLFVFAVTFFVTATVIAVLV